MRLMLRSHSTISESSDVVAVKKLLRREVMGSRSRGQGDGNFRHDSHVGQATSAKPSRVASQVIAGRHVVLYTLGEALAKEYQSNFLIYLILRPSFCAMDTIVSFLERISYSCCCCK
jgi:hypothetical protein